MQYLINLILVVILYSCENADPNAVENRIKILATSWKFTLNLNGDILPFNGSFSKIKSHSATLTLRNGEEDIIIKDVKLQNDSVIVPLPFFNTEMRLSIESPYMLSGVWVNLDKENYTNPLNAEHGRDFRVTNTSSHGALPLR